MKVISVTTKVETPQTTLKRTRPHAAPQRPGRRGRVMHAIAHRAPYSTIISPATRTTMMIETSNDTLNKTYTTARRSTMSRAAWEGPAAVHTRIAYIGTCHKQWPCSCISVLHVVLDGLFLTRAHRIIQPFDANEHSTASPARIRFSAFNCSRLNTDLRASARRDFSPSRPCERLKALE